jgi:AraC-like DNA-binding protein
MWGAHQCVQEPVMSAIPGGVRGFQAAICENYFPYEIDNVVSAEAFESTAAVGYIGPLKISRTYVGNPFSGGRARATHANERNAYILMFIEDGAVHFRSMRYAVAHTGDMILLNSDKALETRQEAIGFSLAVSIPASLLKLRYADVDEWCLIPLTTTEGSSAILRDCLTAYWRTQTGLHAPEYNDLAMSLIHLIGACFRNRFDLPNFDSQSMQAHFLRIRAMVAESLVDPELSADMISARLGISKSYLFMIMNAANTTLGHFILEQRLERSREMLGDPTLRTRTISEIAFSTGFQELSHFSRRFTERFGRSPRAYRASALQAFAGPTM